MARTGLGLAIERKIRAEIKRLDDLILAGDIEIDQYKVRCAERAAFLEAIEAIEEAENDAEASNRRI